MRTAIVTLLAVLGFASVLIHQANAQANGASNDNLIAIDLLLQPDQTMISKANAVNTRLRGNYPGGYSLDATHAPHVTLLQRFVRVKDLEAMGINATYSSTISRRGLALIVVYMKEAEPPPPKWSRFKRSERLAKITLHVHATVINSTMVTSHGPKMVQGCTEMPLKNERLEMRI